jgi:GTP-binding protein HflX
MKPMHSTIAKPERAILVGVQPEDDRGLFPMDDSIAELGQLAMTAGAEVLESVIQRRRQPSPANYVGKGKLQELVRLQESSEADVVFFDDELSPSQQRNLENALKVKVLDRTALILDIFARRAATREGRLQVELALHQYLLPRLAGQWSHLERLGGGIGTRGPGETQLETDRRLIRGRIERLKRELDAVRRHRHLYRRRRSGRGVPVIALVGYTNAGKSTLMNALARAGVLAEGKPFATLDPTTRRVKLPSQREILLTDTVGFIQKLPTQLVAAFRATLEELDEASLLLHVVDISHPKAAEQAQTVDDLLAELGLGPKPTVLVANKVDRLVGPERAGELGELEDDVRLGLLPSSRLGSESRETVLVSAALGWGLDAVLDKITEKLGETMVEVTAEVPYSAPGLMLLVRRYGQVLEEQYSESGTTVRARVPAHLGRRLEGFKVLPKRKRSKVS